MLLATPLSPASPQAQAIADLFDDTLIVCGVIFFVVAGLVTFAIIRFRDRGGKSPKQVEGHTRLEIGWTILPILILIGLFGLTARAMDRADPPADRDPDLTVIAHQWWWEVRYKSGAVTANEIHIPAGKALVVAIESADVAHDFWVPDLARKMDAIPGRTSTIWMQANTPGTYIGACAEYCGPQHAWMRILVIADSAADFAAWEQHTLTSAPTPTTDETRRGASQFAQMTCVKCHSINGNGEAAHTGPDLTHLADRTTLGAGVMKNTPSELARWLKDPQAIKQGSHMPNVQLSDAQVSDFVAYFGTLK